MTPAEISVYLDAELMSTNTIGMEITKRSEYVTGGHVLQSVSADGKGRVSAVGKLKMLVLKAHLS